MQCIIGDPSACSRALRPARSRCQKRPHMHCLGSLPPRLYHPASDQEILRPLEEKLDMNAKCTGVRQGCGINKQGHSQYRY